MEANTGTTKTTAAANKAAGATGDNQEANQTTQRLNEFTEGLQQTFDRAQQQLSSTVTKLRQEAANVDFDGARVRAKTWVEENPTLAVAVAIGAGLLVGKALGSALTPEPPPTFKRRALMQAQRMQHYASDLSQELAQKAALAGGAVLAGTTAAATVASRKAQEVGHVVAEGAQHLGHRAAEGAQHLGHRAVDYAEDVLDQVQDVTKDGRKQLKKKTKKARRQAEYGLDFAGSLLDAARTAVAAVVVKKITDWTRKMA